MRRSHGALVVVATVISTAGLIVGGGQAVASIAQPTVASATPSSLTPHAIDDSVVGNAAVNAYAQVGSVMYAGGKFHSVQEPARKTTLVRTNLFSFDVATGNPTAWAPNVNGEVWRTLYVAPYLYVGGSFTNADGVASRLVRYDLSSGTPVIDSAWIPKDVGGTVNDLEYAGGRLYVAGSFKKRLVALDPANGGNTGYVNLGISGSVKVNGAGPTEVYRIAINPAGTRLVAIGNFTTAGGQSRYRAFMADLGGASATLDPWYYQPLVNNCSASTLRAQLRDVDFGPDGSYFVVAATGYVVMSGGLFRDICDAAARFETNIASPTRPTWINYTGGDTLHSIAATGAAVYVGGHQRWLDNPYGNNSAGPGAVSRQGVGAIDPVTGKALAWNPGKTRGVGTKAIYPTPAGVWFGSDGRRFAGVIHDSIAFTPLS
jgi:hypothetical protein